MLLPLAYIDILFDRLHNPTMSTHKTREPQLPPMAPLTVRFPVDDLEAMRRLAKRNHRSLNAEIVHAVAEYICRQGTESDGGEHGEQETS
ncbi:MAG TPA: Arc family DNA-binding protein [Ktedonobacterales bacterium]